MFVAEIRHSYNTSHRLPAYSLIHFVNKSSRLDDYNIDLKFIFRAANTDFLLFPKLFRFNEIGVEDVIWK